MKTRQLRCVVAAARTGNFSRTAEQCRVAQPSLSEQFQELEDELGERRFDRLKRGVKFTAHGEAFIQRAARILLEVDAAKLTTPVRDSTVRALVSLMEDEQGGYRLAVELHSELPGIDRALAQRSMNEAHKTCPYSEALRGGTSVKLVVD